MIKAARLPLLLFLLIGMAFAWRHGALTAAQSGALSVPGFHHLHLNSTNPDAAIDFYTRQFPSTAKARWAGIPALRSPNNVLVLFTKVNQAPPTAGTAIWHFGWHVTDVRKNLEEYKRRREVALLPLYTTDAGGSVFISSDTWPGTGGVLGLTKDQIAQARAKGVQPAGGPGFAYLQGPDNAIVEYQGNFPAERFNHVHMYHEAPFCAQLWYQRHLMAAVPQAPAGVPQRTEADCNVPRAPDRTWPALEKEGTFRAPSAGVLFGDVSLNAYMRQGDRPLVSTRGHLADHVALSVTNLDAWVDKLRREGIAIVEQPHALGDTRAAMIEGPSREAIELVEVR